jgi:carbohydrate kinase (thermoresistant glucokinase family)
MGVSGSGKTTLGEALARALDCPFQDGDALHSAESLAKMAGGTPLTDADRAPWLARIADLIDRWRAEARGGVIACSALKRAYRARIIGRRTGVRLVFLRGDRDLIRERMESRGRHFMPPALLDSQFADLEPPAADEQAIVVDVAAPAAEIVADIIRQLTNGGGRRP